MTRISIRTRAGKFLAELDDSPVSDQIWLSLPYETTLNMWGDEVYFEVPADPKGGGDITVLDEGDVAFWPEGRALCLFFGPTPLSGEDGRPVSIRPVKRIGRLLDEYGSLAGSGDGTKVVLERAF